MTLGFLQISADCELLQISENAHLSPSSYLYLISKDDSRLINKISSNFVI